MFVLFSMYCTPPKKKPQRNNVKGECHIRGKLMVVEGALQWGQINQYSYYDLDTFTEVKIN